MAIIQTIGLSKTYNQGDVLVKALKPTDITINQGELVAIVGSSGSGKSTLLHLLGGLDRPTEGQVFLDGQEISRLSEHELAVLRRRKIGFVFQFFNLIPVLTAEENILLPLQLDKRPAGTSATELLDQLGISHRRHHLPAQLSGGEQQRVAIARAMINRPSVLLADEPTGNLDTTASQEVLDLLQVMGQTYNQTIVLVTHDPKVAARAGRVLHVVDGVVTEGGHMG